MAIIRYTVVYALVVGFAVMGLIFFTNGDILLGIVAIGLSWAIGSYDKYLQVGRPFRYYWPLFIASIESLGFESQKPKQFKKFLKRALTDISIFPGDLPCIDEIWLREDDDVTFIAGKYDMGSNLYRGIYMMGIHSEKLPEWTFADHPHEVNEHLDQLFIKGKGAHDFIDFLPRLPGSLAELWRDVPYVNIQTHKGIIAASYNLRVARKLKVDGEVFATQSFELLTRLSQYIREHVGPDAVAED